MGTIYTKVLYDNRQINDRNKLTKINKQLKLNQLKSV